MMRVLRFFALVLALYAAAAPANAPAHPLGNFTINHLAKFSASNAALHVRYVLDIAEIPSFQIMHAQGDAWNANRMREWTNAEIAVVRRGLRVSVDGTAVTMQPNSARTTLRAGAGGLPILRWVGTFSIPMRAGVRHRISVRDDVYADRRIGWKDIIAGTQSEPTDELRRYPSALIVTPRRVNAAAFDVENSGAIARIEERADEPATARTLSAWVSPAALSDMFSRPNQTALFVVLTILAAFGLGALHALEPGHGKALLAFTLVGARATSKQALILAFSLTVAHTAGVLLLGVVLFAAAGFVSETIYPWITLLSGAAIAIIGARALARYVRILRGRAHAHAHRHGDHEHSHAIAGTQPLNFRSAVVAAMSGGIAPCPAAIVVLLTALRLHELPYGVFLILVFSMGLASVLSGLGIGVVHGAAWLSKRSLYARFAEHGPLFTALVISCVGAWTLASGFAEQGAGEPVLAIAAVALAAIAGYALAQHGHEHLHSQGEAQSL